MESMVKAESIMSMIPLNKQLAMCVRKSVAEVLSKAGARPPDDPPLLPAQSAMSPLLQYDGTSHSPSLAYRHGSSRSELPPLLHECPGRIQLLSPPQLLNIDAVHVPLLGQ
jgi:hypothetical protein